MDKKAVTKISLELAGQLAAGILSNDRIVRKYKQDEGLLSSIVGDCFIVAAGLVGRAFDSISDNDNSDKTPE